MAMSTLFSLVKFVEMFALYLPQKLYIADNATDKGRPPSSLKPLQGKALVPTIGIDLYRCKRP